MTRRVIVFDTTLRDGEQAPGNSLSVEEKVRLARQLEVLGVDVIEAGFPASSETDFRSVQEIAAQVRRPGHRRAGALHRAGHRPGRRGDPGCRPRPDPRLPLHLRPPPQGQAPDDAARRPSSGSGRACGGQGALPRTWSGAPRTRAAPGSTSSASVSRWRSARVPPPSTFPTRSATRRPRSTRDVPRGAPAGARIGGDRV